MAKKIGVYVCTGCGIGDALDIDKVTKVAEKEYKCPVVRTHAHLCGKEGVELIKKDLEGEEGVNAVIVAGCSGRVNTDVFNFGPSVMVERVNLREHVVWCHPANDEDTDMIAEDNMRMGIVKVQKSELPEPYIEEGIVKTILVVGGGLVGLTAALEAAAAGYKVVLIEKEASLGGWVAKQYKQVALRPPYDELRENDIQDIIKQVEDNPNITVYTSAKSEGISGGPGIFEVTINQNGNTVKEKVGAIVLATGAKPYDATKLAHLGFGRFQDVVTKDQFEEMASSGKITRPSDGKEVQSVTFIQCAGSRDPEHLPYCSAECCVGSLRQALYVKEQNPDATAVIIYKDLRAAGQYEFLYKKAQSEGVVFIKGEVVGVNEAGGQVSVEAEDVVRGETVQVDSDLVVLATGMVPTTAFGEEELTVEVKEGEEAEAAAAAADTIIRSDILNLQYRQGPELPSLKYGFPDSHFICFPYESRRTGIYPAGTVRAPMDVRAAIDDAAGAALKAIQCVELTAKGAAVHPRALDFSFPEFNLSRCTQCKRCTEECPFGAINEDEKTYPLPHPTRCRRCGTCMGACPERIISFKNYSVGMIGSMLKNIEVPEEFEEKPRILVFACENDAIPALDIAGINRLEYNPWIRIIPVRCLGSLNLIWIADAMSNGFDGVMLLGCKHGDDYQCHFVKGSELAEIRLSKISETLDRLRLESERVQMRQVSIMDYDQIPKILDEFAEKLEELGPNPMKDF
ncbi:MAG: FAD-dependent oxidoreductase [Peptococcaceae bacterium]|nr:FAD-dependent oxidoreductase [Peptococcaceae bacterium]